MRVLSLLYLSGEGCGPTGRTHLLLNVAKTRETVADFRGRRTATQPLNMEIAEDYKSRQHQQAGQTDQEGRFCGWKPRKLWWNGGG